MFLVCKVLNLPECYVTLVLWANWTSLVSSWGTEGGVWDNFSCYARGCAVEIEFISLLFHSSESAWNPGGGSWDIKRLRSNADLLLVNPFSRFTYRKELKAWIANELDERFAMVFIIYHYQHQTKISYMSFLGSVHCFQMSMAYDWMRVRGSKYDYDNYRDFYKL